ncbi:MAG: NB-ARC domain-containing protein, partial [Planctomycetota bacterium]
MDQLLADKRPWSAFLSLGAAAESDWDACPDVPAETLEWMASGAVGFLSASSVGPLTPVCEAFAALIEEARGGAAEGSHELSELVAWCAFLTEVLLWHGHAKEKEGSLGPISATLDDFVSTTGDLAKRAKCLGARRKCVPLLCFRKVAKRAAFFEVKLRGIWKDVQELTTLALDDVLRAALAPNPGEMCEIPLEARELPPAHVHRAGLVEAVVQDLVAAGRPALKAHVLLGMPGRGKTVAAVAAVRSAQVRRSFKDGIFWVQAGKVGSSSPTALLRGLSEDLSRAPADPLLRSAVPLPRGEFCDVEHAVGHLADVRRRAGLARSLVVLDDVRDEQVVPLLVRSGFHCLVTARDLEVVPAHVRGACTEVGALTSGEALDLLKNASGATLDVPSDEGLKVGGRPGRYEVPSPRRRRKSVETASTVREVDGVRSLVRAQLAGWLAAADPICRETPPVENTLTARVCLTRPGIVPCPRSFPASRRGRRPWTGCRSLRLSPACSR